MNAAEARKAANTARANTAAEVERIIADLTGDITNTAHARIPELAAAGRFEYVYIHKLPSVPAGYELAHVAACASNRARAAARADGFSFRAQMEGTRSGPVLRVCMGWGDGSEEADT